MGAAYLRSAVLAATLVASCGGGGNPQKASLLGSPNDPTPPAPASTPAPAPPPGAPSLQFNRPLVFTLGVTESMPADIVSSDTTITVEPALPSGLTLEAATGTISGTPSALSPGRTYTLAATNAQGTVNAQVNLEVNDGPLFYSSPAILRVGTAMTPLAPSGTKYLSGYSVHPPLPSGLSLDPTTGVISGTPIGVSPASYYQISGTDAGFSRDYGLTLAVVDPSRFSAPLSVSPYDCAYSGGFVGSFAADASSASYGLIAIAFTPGGHAHARVADLTTNAVYDSDGLEGLSAGMDGSFSINFPPESGLSLRGQFDGPDLISGTYQSGSVSKSFMASRLGGSPSATYRYTGGFGSNNGYRIDFGTVDVSGSSLSGAGYQMTAADEDYVLTNRQLSFATTINDGMFTVTVDSSTTSFAYVTGESRLTLGDPYDGLFFIVTYGCQLN